LTAARTLGELAELAGAQVRGEAGLLLRGVATLAGAGPDQIGFLANPKYREQLETTRAAAVVLTAADAEIWKGNALISANPYLSFARIAECFAPEDVAVPGIHPGATVHPGAKISPDAAIEAGCVIEAGAVIGARVRLGANCTVGTDAVIADDSRLHANVVICRGVEIGRRCLLHPGVVIGADGFGQARDGERWRKVPQLGGVRIGDDVEIGANTTVDRGALEDTVIESGVRLDNQIQVAHNVRIGANTAIAGCTAIAGSVTIGRRCMIAGGVGIAGHLEIADDVTVLAMTLVTHSIREKGVYAGSHPIEDVRSWRKNNARLRQLDELARKVKRLEQQLQDVLSEKGKK
jgi:UDP-3-O-[3-hydroxymyristoyl] glucosamine N-acyltransferase